MNIIAQLPEAVPMDLLGGTIEEIKVDLLALAPLLTIVLSAIGLRPDAAKAVKKAAPGVASVVVVVVYLAATQWPQHATTVVVQIGLVLATATKIYDSLNGLVKAATAGRKSLSDLFGPGFVSGPPVLDL